MELNETFEGNEGRQEEDGCAWYLCIFHKKEIEKGKLPSWVIPAPSPIHQDTPVGTGRLVDLQLGLVSSSDVKKYFDPNKGNRLGGTYKGAITILSALSEPPPWAQHVLKSAPAQAEKHAGGEIT